jgi:hypothetical protein
MRSSGSYIRNLSLGLLLLGAGCLPFPVWADSGAPSLLERLEGIGRALEGLEAGLAEPAPQASAVIQPQSGGAYPAGWFTGVCRELGRPEQPVIGQAYQVISTYTAFDLWDDGRWDFDVRVQHPYRGPGYEYECSPDKDRVLLPARYVPRNRGDLRYRMVVTGTIRDFEVRRCQTVGGGPCPVEIGREEIREESEFTVVRSAR